MAAITELTVIQPIGLDIDSHLSFTLLNNQDLFTIGKTSGVVSTKGVGFDREKRDNYTLVIMVNKVMFCVFCNAIFSCLCEL